MALPTLITGTTEVANLPARYDIEVGHAHERSAIAAGSMTTALETIDRRRDAMIVRQNLPEVLAEHPDRPAIDDLRAWGAALSDDEVRERMSRLRPGHSVETLLRTAEVAGELVEEMRKHQAESAPLADA